MFSTSYTIQKNIITLFEVLYEEFYDSNNAYKSLFKKFRELYFDFLVANFDPSSPQAPISKHSILLSQLNTLLAIALIKNKLMESDALQKLVDDIKATEKDIKNSCQQLRTELGSVSHQEKFLIDLKSLKERNECGTPKTRKNVKSELFTKFSDVVAELEQLKIEILRVNQQKLTNEERISGLKNILAIFAKIPSKWLSTEHKRQIIGIKKNLSNIYKTQSMFKEYLIELNDALIILNSLADDPAEKLAIYLQLGEGFFHTEQFDKTIDIYTTVLDMLDTLPPSKEHTTIQYYVTLDLVTCYNNIAREQIKTGAYAEAAENLISAIDLLENLPERTAVNLIELIKLYKALTSTYLKMKLIGEAAECSLLTVKLLDTLGESQNNELTPLKDQLDTLCQQSFSLHKKLAQQQLANNQFAEATKTFMLAEQMFNRISLPKTDSDKLPFLFAMGQLHKYQAKIYTMENNNELATFYFKKARNDYQKILEILNHPITNLAEAPSIQKKNQKARSRIKEIDASLLALEAKQLVAALGPIPFLLYQPKKPKISAVTPHLLRDLVAKKS